MKSLTAPEVDISHNQLWIDLFTTFASSAAVDKNGAKQTMYWVTPPMTSRTEADNKWRGVEPENVCKSPYVDAITH